MKLFGRFMSNLGICAIAWCLSTVFGGGPASISAQEVKKTDICHFDAESETWTRISVGNPAVNAHFRNHDDGTPGGTTSRSATELDATCTPVPPGPAFVCPDTDQLGFPLGVNFLEGNGNWFCSYPAVEGEDPFDFFCRYNSSSGALVQDNNAGLCPPTAKDNPDVP